MGIADSRTTRSRKKGLTKLMNEPTPKIDPEKLEEWIKSFGDAAKYMRYMFSDILDVEYDDEE